MTDQWTILKGNPPDPYVDVLIMFPSNMAVGFIDRDSVWSVYSGGGWYTEVAKNDEQPMAWRTLNQESIEALEKRVHELEWRANPMKPTRNLLGEWVCKCGRVINELDNYCPECGQAVKWE